MTNKKDTKPDPLNLLKSVLSDGGLACEPLEDGTGYFVTLDDELYEGAMAFVLTDESRFVFYVDFKAKVPSSRRMAMAELLTRINFGILIGNFEMDFDDGTVRYKSSVDFEGEELTYLLIKNAIKAARDGVEDYGKAVELVSSGKRTPLEAINEIEAE